jgi:hypothetical protein
MLWLLAYACCAWLWLHSWHHSWEHLPCTYLTVAGIALFFGMLTVLLLLLLLAGAPGAVCKGEEVKELRSHRMHRCKPDAGWHVCDAAGNIGPALWPNQSVVHAGSRADKCSMRLRQHTMLWQTEQHSWDVYTLSVSCLYVTLQVTGKLAQQRA